jgi:hypothetical protein
MTPHYMIFEVCGDGLGHFRLCSQFHDGHGSWLVCEVALIMHIISVGMTTLEPLQIR